MNEFWRDFQKGQRVTLRGQAFGVQSGSDFIVTNCRFVPAAGSVHQVVSLEPIIEAEYTVKRVEQQQQQAPLADGSAARD